jgi:predicted HicB family RNase H-like nuclease
MKRSRGRPTKPPDERKAAHVIVRVDQTDRAEFEEAAESADLSLSNWIRDRLKAAAKRERRRASTP